MTAHSPDPRIDFTAIKPAQLTQLVCGMPKAELHLHIEGSLEPELMFELAQKNRIQLPYANVHVLRAAYAFEDLQSFLDIYYAGASVLITEDDFFAMAWAYLKRAAADNIVRAEIFFDPQTHTERGVAMSTVILGLSRALAKARAELGVDGALILCFLRHLSEASALETLAAALPLRDHFIGVGLDSSERGHPPEKFKRVFAKAKAEGLQLVAHAGEEGPAEYIWNALDQLHVTRIDHGVRCVEDPRLVEHLALQRTPLTVCPLSNIKLRVFNSMAEHNLGALLASGLCITLNSDDPAYFGGYLNQNFTETFEGLSLSARDAWQFAANSFEASFVPPEQKALWVKQLDQFFLKYGSSGIGPA
jgi:adenine deaminase